MNRTELSGMRGAKGRGKVIRKGYNYIISYLFLIHTISYYYTYHIFTYYRDYHIITLYLLQGLLQGLTLSTFTFFVPFSRSSFTSVSPCLGPFI